MNFRFCYLTNSNLVLKNDSFFKKYNLDKQKNFTLMSSLVPVSLGTSGGNVGPKNAKHSAKVFSFDTSKSGYQRVKSSYWLQETVDLTKDSGIYVPIDQFQYEGKRGRDATYNDPSYLGLDIKNLNSLGIVCPKIYGFKKDVVEKIKNNKALFISEKIFTLNREEYYKQSLDHQRLFDCQSIIICLMLRKEFGQVKLHGFLKISDKNIAIHKIYGFKNLNHFDKQYIRYMRDISSDIAANKTPDTYLKIVAAKVK